MEKEIWKDVKDYEGIYKISNLGRLKSLKRKGTGTFTNKEIILKKGINTKGYYTHVLSKNGKTRTRTLHRLVAEHFIDNPNNQRCVNHKDGKPKNNNISNLEWCSYSENSLHGYRSNGRKNSRRKLTELQVSEIKSRLDNWYIGLGVQLAKEYNVSVWIISLIRNNKTYQFVPKLPIN